jgi:hypothetical protein
MTLAIAIASLVVAFIALAVAVAGGGEDVTQRDNTGRQNCG